MSKLPLEGIRVVEFTHMIMGPSTGMILGDMGAEVIKVEPLEGDNTRRLIGTGAGFFAIFNRNKKSVTLDIKSKEGKQAALDLIKTADIFVENFKEGTMKKLGLDYKSLKEINPRLIYVSHKGFLEGPYSHRPALDEVVQMMGGLAFMTGPKGRPLRAGASVNDVMGGMFGVIGALAALLERAQTGQGKEIHTALYENNALLMAQHMMQYALTGIAADPMPSRISAWGIYDVFESKEGEQLFLGVVSDTQWVTFCDCFEFSDLAQDERLKTNNQRVLAREWMMPLLRDKLSAFSTQEISVRFEENALPYAAIGNPKDLLTDEHLLKSGGLAPIFISEDASGASKDVETLTPLLPFTMNGERMPIRLNPPRIGEHNDEFL